MTQGNKSVWELLKLHMKNVLPLMTITTVMTFFLLLVYYLTHQELNVYKEVELMLGEHRSQYIIQQNNLTRELLENSSVNDKSYYEYYFENSSEILQFNISDTDSKKPVMTVFAMNAPGYGGLVTMLVGTDGNSIQAVRVIDVSTESAGLGKRAKELWFQRQFVGKTKDQIPLNQREWPEKSLDMISGASYTSLAVAENIYNAFELYDLNRQIRGHDE